VSGSGSGSGKQGPSNQRPKPQHRAAGGGSPAARKRPSTAKASGKQQPAKQQRAKQQPAKQQRKTATRPEAPRSTKVVIDHIDPISVLKLSVLFYLSLALALFIAGVLLWTVARSSGLVANIEGLIADVGFTDFQLRTSPLLGASALASVVLVVTGSLANLLMALLYNLIGDVVGGLKVVLVQVKDSPKR
jgi:hypothetical protein